MLTRNFEVQPIDLRVLEALRFIYDRDGVVCTPNVQPLFIYGYHPNIDPADVWDQVWFTKGDEVLPASNLIDTVVSDNAADTVDVEIGGLTVSDGDFARVTQTATLNGTTPVELNTVLARATSIKVLGDVKLMGAVKVKQSGAGTEHLKINPYHAKSMKATFTTAANEYALVRQFGGDLEMLISVQARYRLEVREPGGLFLPVVTMLTSEQIGHVCIDFDPFVVVPPNTDVRVVGRSSAMDASLHAFVNVTLATIVV